MWLDIVIELIAAGLEALFSGPKGWKERRRLRKEIKAKRREQKADDAGDGTLIQHKDN